ncbi:lactoylglutathione lyase [Anthocerotibacter panamensis]|uniref:lactoylglutathione lyase n=1 Tax=Anthocerotibacter panamensis TaxID=2857077 RepID=UPI001C408795|nr:lactoylglutathione lyase [Anthocerotibacter panamensis]
MRILHTMLRVKDLEASKAFYCDVLGMKLLREKEYPNGQFTLAFVGYGDETDNAVLELTYNWGKDDYVLGEAFGHVALGVEDIEATCAEAVRKGARLVRAPGPMKHGTTIIAFLEDPNGYKIELIQQKPVAPSMPLTTVQV